uniref:mL123 n=1 Tax=Polytomella magna TaxID=353565 RepID=UPI002240E410|nr:Chain Xd, mL123 [Polytomella magna]8APN_Xd Chain Xd, mL123 [Polytomella magna]8APO_Xd Chain Xd, mL123 [Polytomella magna]
YRNKVTIEYIKLKEPENDDYATRDPTNYAQLLGAISISRHLDRTTYLYETFKDKFDTIHYVTALTKLPGLVHYRGADLVMRDGVQWSEGVKPFWQKPNAQPRKHLLPKAQGLLSKLEEQFPPHLNNLFPRQTANLIWAYGQLKRKQVVAACPFLGDFLLSLRRDNFLALDKHATGADYAQIVKGLANLQTAGSPADEDTRALIEDFVDQLTQEMLLRRGHARLLDAREAQSILWGLGKLNRRKNTAIIDVLCDVVLAGVNSLTPTALAGAFSALAKLGHSSRTDVFEAMAKGYHLQTTLMSPQDVSLTVCACADLGFRDDNLLKICGLKAADMLGEFSNASLAWLMAGFGRLGYNHEAFFSAVNKSVLAEPVVEVEPGFAWRVLSAYAGSGRKDSESLKVCGRITEAFLAKLY